MTVAVVAAGALTGVLSIGEHVAKVVMARMLQRVSESSYRYADSSYDASCPRYCLRSVLCEDHDGFQQCDRT